MDMIRPGVYLDEPGILDPGDGAQIGSKTMAPLRINGASPPFGAPDKMEIDAEIFPRHALFNSIEDEVVKKISAKSAAPMALIFTLIRIPA